MAVLLVFSMITVNIYGQHLYRELNFSVDKVQLRKKASSGFLRHHHCRYAPVLQNLKDYMTQGIKALLNKE